MSVYLLAFLIGCIAGLRTLTAPAAVSWAAYLGRLHLEGTPLAFLGYAWTPYVLSALAIAELITDQLPQTPSRKTPVQFAARIVSAALCGAALGASGGAWAGGLAAGVIGAVIGTFGGYAFRKRLAAATNSGGHLAGAIEDAIAIGGAALIVVFLS